MKEARRKALKRINRWAFALCAAAVAVLMIIKGHQAYAVWPVLAAAFNWIADSFQELVEEAVDYGDSMAQLAIEMSAKLADAEFKIAQLEKQLGTDNK